MTHTPSFRHELNLAAEAPDGSLAAYVGVLYDEANRRGFLSRLARRRHLAQAVLAVFCVAIVRGNGRCHDKSATFS